MMLAVAAIAAASCRAGSEPGDEAAIDVPQSNLALAIEDIGGERFAKPRDEVLSACLGENGVDGSAIREFMERRDEGERARSIGFGVASRAGDRIEGLVDDYVRMVTMIEEMAGVAIEPSAEGKVLPFLDECTARVQETVLAPLNGFRNEFAGDLVRIQQAFQADPKVVTFWAEWRECMASAGHPAGTMGSLTAQFQIDLQGIVMQIDVRPRLISPADLFLSDDDKQRIVEGRVSLDVQGQLDELLAEEELVAAVSASCGAPPSSGDTPPALVDTRIAIEDEYFEANKQRIEFWRERSEAVLAG